MTADVKQYLLDMDLDKLCRLCAGTSSVLHPIFTNNTATEMVEKIQICSTIQISADDGLPTTICLPCYDKLTAAYSFRLQIVSAQVKLRHLFRKAELTDWNILEPLCDIKTENTNNESNNYVQYPNYSATKTTVEKPSTILEPLCSIKTDNSDDSDSKKSYDLSSTEKYENSDEESNSEAEKRLMTQTTKKRRTRRTMAGPNASTVCPFCGMILKQSSFSDHISNVHKEEASVECEECGKMLKNKRQLWHHKRKHQDNKVSCDKCGKTYKTKDGFRVHYRDVHLGIRNHSCTICNKSFPRTIALKRHMRSHTGEKPYVCPYCGRGFSGNWNLKQHIRLHTKEKPYRCQICSEGFTQNVMLKVHMRNKHK